MTSHRMWQRCLTRVGDLPHVAKKDLEAALRCVDSGFARLVTTLSGDFGLEGTDRELREDALIFEFAAIQVADDLADGDCDYVRDAARAGPGLHWTLQHLFYRCLLQSHVPREDIDLAARDLVLVGGAQQVEVRVREWDGEQSEQAALGLNGRQYAAYFRLLSAGTPFAERAIRVGEDFGFALHVVTDIASGDERWVSLDGDAKGKLVRRARERVVRAAEGEIPGLRDALGWFGGVLEGAARSTPG